MGNFEDEDDIDIDLDKCDTPSVDGTADVYILPAETMQTNDGWILKTNAICCGLKNVADKLSEISTSVYDPPELTSTTKIADIKLHAIQYGDGHWEIDVPQAKVLCGVPLLPWLTEVVALGIRPIQNPEDLNEW